MFGFLKDFLKDERAQVSIEFILLTGGVVVAAVTFYSIQGTIVSFADVVADWTEAERNVTMQRLTR